VTYATRDDMATRVGPVELAELTDRAGGSTLDEAVLDAALADASATIDAYLATRYAVPVSPVPAVLTQAACAIARYRLRGASAGEAIRRDHDDALALLRDLAAGTALLAGATKPAEVAVGPVRVDAPARALSLPRLADYLG
jgi:phage gp36-like protein